MIEDINKLVSDGKLSCWSCKNTLSLKNLRAVNFDTEQFFYDCDRCGNSGGIRSFKSLGFNTVISLSAIRGKVLPYSVIVNNEVFGKGEKASTPIKVFKVIIAKPIVRERPVKVEINDLPLSDDFKKAVVEDIKICGEKRYWIDTSRSAMAEGVDIISYLKKCDEDFRKHNKKYGVNVK